MNFTAGEFVILCYGDSNTRGSIPNGDHERYPRTVRWPGYLQHLIGKKYQIIEEGLGGRTTCLDDPQEQGRNGRTYLMPCLKSHRPIDLVILLLGTNDLKAKFALTAQQIAENIGKLVRLIYTSQAARGNIAPAVLLIAPPPLGKLSDFKEEFEGGTLKSLALAELYRIQAKEHGCEFLNAGAVIRSSDEDGIHWEADEHRKLAEEIAKRIKRYKPLNSSAAD